MVNRFRDALEPLDSAFDPAGLQLADGVEKIDIGTRNP